MGGAVSVSNNNDDMVTKLVNADYIKTRSVEQAFRAVDRGNYVMQKDSAYSDTAWKTEHVHVSAPCIYAQVLEGLFLQPGQSFLNIGSGTGYLSTMVAMIIGREGSNHGVELRADVIKYALVRLKQFKTTSAYNRHHFADPVFVEGDAFHLLPPKNKYDRIYCGAAVPLSYLDMLRDNFLNVGGVVVAPVEDELLQVYKESPSRDICTSLLDVSFLHLIRRGRGAAGSRPDGADDGVTLPCHNVRSLQEQCRSLIVRHVRGKLMREKTTRGGIFALCFTSENCPPVPEPPRRRPGAKCPRNKTDEKKHGGGFNEWSTAAQQRHVNYRSSVELPLVTEGDSGDLSYNRVSNDDFLNLGTSTTSRTVDTDEADETTDQKASSSRDSGSAASLPSNSHSNVEEPLTSCPFLNREASVLGYRDDRKVIRVCGRTLLETHSSHLPKKDNEVVNKHPPYMLRNSYQPTEEDSMDSMDLFGLNHNDTDDEAHVRNQPTNTLGHSVRSLISLNDDVLSDSSSDSTLSSEEKPGKDDSDQEIDLPRSVVQQRKVKSFNARVRARQNQDSSTSSFSGTDAPLGSVFASLPIETKSLSEAENSRNSIAEKCDPTPDDSTNLQKLKEIVEENSSLASCSLLKFPEGDHLMEVDEANVSGRTAEVNTSKVSADTSAPNYFQSDNSDASMKVRSYLKRSSSEDDDMASDNSRSGFSSDEETLKGSSGSRRKKAIKRQTGAGPKERSSRCQRSPVQDVTAAVEPSASATGGTTQTNESSSALDAMAAGVLGDEVTCDSDVDSSNDGFPRNTGPLQPSAWESRNVASADLLHIGIQRFPNNFEQEEDANMSREISRRASQRVSMISLLRLAYSHVGESDRRNDGLLNEEEDLSSEDEVDDDGDDDDDDDVDEEVIDKKRMKDACGQEQTPLHGACAFSWFRFPMSEAELSSSDEEPEYFKKSLSGLDYSSDNDFGKKKMKKKKSKLWVKGTDGFDCYIDYKHSKLPFRKLPKETRFEIRTQTRLFCLPLPQRILDYLLYGSSLQVLP